MSAETTPAWRIGIDIGGTFTDIALSRQDSELVLWKQDTTPEQLEEAVEKGLAAAADLAGVPLSSLLGDCELLVHGSTVATNMLITRRGPRLGLLCTEGFRDTLTLRDGFKPERFDPNLARPRDLVDRWLIRSVGERVMPDGSIDVPLDEGSVHRAAEVFARSGVEAVAVALLWSQVNDAHERRIQEILVERLPSVPVLLSSQILPEIGEWVRTSATVLSAYVYERSSSYLKVLEQWLRDQGLRRELLVMQINGGSSRVDQVLKVPVSLVHSGPAAAPAASSHLAQCIGHRDVITIDMGGTSFDVCLMRGGEIPLSRTQMFDEQPVGVPAVHLHSIGAGGGSIGWVDDGGALRVGPQSAGAQPGPAAYDRGGNLPTITDANVVLGYLSPDAFLGGRRTLRRDLAEEAIRKHVMEPLGLDSVHEAAAGMLRVVEDTMANAIRAVTVERGIDPRPALMITGGGAGPLHATRLAKALGLRDVLIPSQAGTLSAYGMTVGDVRHDYVGTAHITSLTTDWTEVQALVKRLETQAREELRAVGFDDSSIRLRRTVDARYVGQLHELMLPLGDGPIDAAFVADATERFHTAHRERYSYDLQSTPIEYLHWRVTGIGLIERPGVIGFDQLDSHEASSRATGSRLVWTSDGFIEVPTFASELLDAGATLEGPVIVDGATTTIVVDAGQRILADGKQGYLVTLPAPATAAGGVSSRSTAGC
jgi:N-methylhydantoinase A